MYSYGFMTYEKFARHGRIPLSNYQLNEYLKQIPQHFPTEKSTETHMVKYDQCSDILIKCTSYESLLDDE